jgi:hypothetical protein
MVARRWAAAGCAGLALVAAAGCGKKGAPLAPYVLLPAAPARVSAQRAGTDVYVTLTLPLQNVDASKPADVRRVEVYAYTATTPPSRARQLELATLVATVPVAAAMPEGALLGQRQRTPETPGAARPGATITVKETLNADAFVPRSLPAPPGPPPRTPVNPAAPTVRPDPPGQLRRFYVAVAFSDRGRPGLASTPVELPLRAVPDAPSGLQVAYTADATLLSWQPAGGVLGFILDNPLPLEALTEEAPPAAADPMGLPPGPTRYHVYRTQAPDPLVLPPPVSRTPVGTVAVQRPITPAPLDGLTFTDSVEFDRERCYEVRAVRGTGPEAVEGAPSEPVCLMPVDVFAPAPPSNLATVVRPGAVDLIWESSPDLDVWGYVVLRGTTGDATLQPLNAAPVIETQFTDTTVTPGTRYVYAVMAVDSRLPVPNVSGESERVEDTAR